MSLRLVNKDTAVVKVGSPLENARSSIRLADSRTGERDCNGWLTRSSQTELQRA